MTQTPTDMLVLKDEAGSYFLVALETVAQGRVPAAQTVQLEQLLAAQRAEVQGYSNASGWRAGISASATGQATIEGGFKPEYVFNGFVGTVVVTAIIFGGVLTSM